MPLLTVQKVKICKFKKNQDGGRPPYWKLKIRIITSTVQPIKMKLCRNMQVAIVNRAESENLRRCVYIQILPKGFEVCANGLIVVKITVAVGGKFGNKTAKISVKTSSIYYLV